MASSQCHSDKPCINEYVCMEMEFILRYLNNKITQKRYRSILLNTQISENKLKYFGK